MSHQIPAPGPRAVRAILVSIALGGMLVPLNSSMIAVALPEIMKEFDASVSAAGWLVTVYLITMATLQLIAGKLGDQLGRRGFLIGGLVYFGIASLLSGLSPTLPILLFLRVQQAIAAAMIVTNGIAIAFEVVPLEQRARTLGSVNAAVVLAAVGGPPLGGFLVGVGGWRAIFWVNIPLVIAALALGWSSIPRVKPNADRQNFDFVGAILFAFILILAVGLLSSYKELNLVESAIGILLLLGAAAFFIRYEKRRPVPLLELQLFGYRSFSSANGAIAFSNTSMYVILLALPILLSERAGWTTMQTSLLLAVMSGPMALFSPVGGYLADRLGRRSPSITGLVLMILSMMPLLWTSASVTALLLFLCLLFAGAGLGLSTPVLQTSALEAAESQHTGMASGISSTSRYMGSILGSSLLPGSLDTSRTSDNFRVVFLVVALAALGAAFFSLGIDSSMPGKMDSEQTEAAPTNARKAI